MLSTFVSIYVEPETRELLDPTRWKKYMLEVYIFRNRTLLRSAVERSLLLRAHETNSLPFCRVKRTPVDPTVSPEDKRTACSATLGLTTELLPRDKE